MKRSLPIGLLLITLLLSGCSQKEQGPRPIETPKPLSLADWKGLPIDIKYDEATFERLKLADPKLQDARAWHDFMAKEIIPERKVDIPGTPGVAAKESPR